MDINTVKTVARLSRIKVSDARAQELTSDLSKIMSFVEQLNDVDTSAVAPLTSVASVTLPRREDVVHDGDQQDAVLVNAPESAHGFFVVPKVVG